MRYAQLRCMDISDGDGIGVSFWVQGCPYHCPGCHNESTWDFDGGMEYDDKVEADLVKCLQEPHVSFFSVLGGEPLCASNLALTKRVIEVARKTRPDITVYVWSGATYEHLMKNDAVRDVLSMCDILIDGPYVESQRDIMLHLRGSRNQRVIDLHTGKVMTDPK